MGKIAEWVYIAEGAKIVGYATILKVLNSNLLGECDA